MQTYPYATHEHVMRLEINLGMPEACELTSLHGHMRLNPETLLNTLPPTVVRKKKKQLGMEKKNTE